MTCHFNYAKSIKLMVVGCSVGAINQIWERERERERDRESGGGKLGVEFWLGYSDEWQW